LLFPEGCKRKRVQCTSLVTDGRNAGLWPTGRQAGTSASSCLLVRSRSLPTAEHGAFVLRSKVCCVVPQSHKKSVHAATPRVRITQHDRSSIERQHRPSVRHCARVHAPASGGIGQDSTRTDARVSMPCKASSRGFTTGPSFAAVANERAIRPAGANKEARAGW
jgi:hypothetical protein